MNDSSNDKFDGTRNEEIYVEINGGINGEGKWDLTNYDYCNFLFEDYVTWIMQSYLTGDIETITQECDFAFPVPDQIATEYDIVEIIYKDRFFRDGNNICKVNVAYTVDYIDTTQYVEIFIKQDDYSDGFDASAYGYGLWKVSKFWTLN